MQLTIQHCDPFDDDDEMLLIYTDIFESFKSLFENRIENFVTSRGVSLEEFYGLCKESNIDNDNVSDFLDMARLWDHPILISYPLNPPIMFTFHKTLEAFRSIFSSKESSLLHVLTPGTCQSLSTSTLEVLSDAINNPALRSI